jgi:hypothetical protein
MANPSPSKPFTKNDPRINRKGRPRTFDALRTLAQQIAHEVALKDGAPLVISGRTVTVAEAILRSWATSKNPMLQKAYIEIAFGKVPDNLDITSAGEKIIVTLKSANDK